MNTREKIVFFLAFSFVLILFFINHLAVIDERSRINDLEDRMQVLESQMDETINDDKYQNELQMMILAELEDTHAQLANNHVCHPQRA